jgi:hypothetical protein
MKISIHLDVDSKEFHHLIQIVHLNLGGQLTLPQPLAPPNMILQPYPNIVHDPMPSIELENDGWGNTTMKLLSGIFHW